jgi:hypothetical protein
LRIPCSLLRVSRLVPRAVGGEPPLDGGDEQLDGLAALQQAGDAFAVGSVEARGEKRLEEGGDLAGDVVEGLDGLKEEDGGGAHATTDDRVGDFLDERKVLGGENVICRGQGEGVLEGGEEARSA